ncbi:hypothetical protein ACFQY4_14410 [Catellatospora bangladeshensis]|uniref:hypothetical protein n=1 Tax=Catellatospora bangladeshensis TaxID=310355 RepID=UPI00360EBB7A
MRRGAFGPRDQFRQGESEGARQLGEQGRGRLRLGVLDLEIMARDTPETSARAATVSARSSRAARTVEARALLRSSVTAIH